MPKSMLNQSATYNSSSCLNGSFLTPGAQEHITHSSRTLLEYVICIVLSLNEQHRETVICLASLSLQLPQFTAMRHARSHQAASNR